MEPSTSGGMDLRENYELGRPSKRNRTSTCDDVTSAATSNDNDASSSTLLPPEVWATVINFLDYQSVLSCSATSKMILRDSLPLVKTLHIDKASQLNGLLASRFRDVREINIFSLLHVNEEDVEEDGIIGNDVVVDTDTVMRAVLFLSRFNKLERVFLGGRDSSGEMMGFDEYNHNNYEQKDRKLVTNLIDQLSHAFYCNFLRKKLLVLGLRCPESCYVSQGSSSCPSCQLACKHWPLEYVINFNHDGSSRLKKSAFGRARPNCLDVCLTRDQIEKNVQARPGGHDLLHSESRLLYLLGQGTRYEIHSDDGGPPFCYVHFFREQIDEIERAIEIAKLDVNKLEREVVVKALARSFAKDGSGWIPPEGRCYLGRATFDALVDPGLPIYEEDWYDQLVTYKQNLPQIVKVLKSDMGDISQILIDCLFLLNRLLEYGKALPIQQAFDLGVLPPLVECLKPNTNPGVISETVRAINNIAQYGTVAHAEALVKTGVIPKLLHVVEVGLAKEAVQCNAVLALGRVARKSTTCRDAVLQENFLTPLLRMLNEWNGPRSLQTASWVISSLCYGDPKPYLELVQPCLEPLSRLLLSDDETVLMDSCGALFHLCGLDEGALAMIDAGIFPRLIELLGHSSQKVRERALRRIICLVMKDKSLIQALISDEVLPSLISIMSSSDSSIQLVASRIVYEISKQCEVQIRAIVSLGCVQSFCALLASGGLNNVELGFRELLRILQFDGNECNQTVNNELRSKIQWTDTKLGELENLINGSIRHNLIEKLIHGARKELVKQKVLLLQKEA